MSMIIGLTVTLAGLFAYDNFIRPMREAKQLTTVYVAKEDIPSYTKITPEMIEEHQIRTDSLIDGVVTNKNEILEKEIKGGLLKGEPILNQRIVTEKSDSENMFFLRIDSDVTGDLANNDNVRVYTILTNRSTGETSVRELFKNKKVQMTTASIGAQAIGNTNAGYFYTRATNEEIKDYYIAKNSGSIVVVKVDPLSSELDSPSEFNGQKVEKFDRDSDEVSQSVRLDSVDGDDEAAIVSHTVAEGDTVQSLSLQLRTSTSNIISANDGKTNLEVGKTLDIPISNR